MELKYKSFEDMPINDYFYIKKELEELTGEKDEVIIFTLLGLLCGEDIDKVYELPMKELNPLIEQIKWFWGPVKSTHKTPKKIRIGDWVLIPCYDVKNLNVAQYIDYEMFAKDRYKYYVDCLSTFLIPEGKKYNVGYDILEVRKLIGDNISIATSEALYLSFAKSSKRLLNRSLRSLMMKMMKKIFQTKKQGMTPIRINLIRIFLQMKQLYLYLNGLQK